MQRADLSTATATAITTSKWIPYPGGAPAPHHTPHLRALCDAIKIIHLAAMNGAWCDECLSVGDKGRGYARNRQREGERERGERELCKGCCGYSRFIVMQITYAPCWTLLLLLLLFGLDFCSTESAFISLKVCVCASVCVCISTAFHCQLSKIIIMKMRALCRSSTAFSAAALR